MNMLLAYTYFLNEAHTVKIVVGFHTELLEATISLHRIGKKLIFINYEDWLEFYQQFHLHPKNKVSCLQFGIKARKPRSFVLRDEEIDKFRNLFDFIHLVMVYNKNAEGCVKDYVRKYIRTCVENQQNILKDEIYIPLNRFNVQCNYSRLFYEIPFLLKELIVKYLNINQENKMLE